jgi:N-acetylmuramoyl-L-alanine amidase-like protein
MPKIAISAGHSLKVRGASGVLDEVDEARRVTTRLGKELASRGVDVRTFWDDTSTTQSENLSTITDWHNSEDSDLAVSVHFNAYVETTNPMGCEVLYVTQKNLAAKVSAAIADAGLINRGAKFRDDLYVLNNTIAPAILLEVAFVDSTTDAEIYNTHFDLICESIANVLGGEEDIQPEPSPPASLFTAVGRCSYFGGPDDEGVAEDEGLALVSSIEQAPFLFAPEIDETKGMGLARRLNPVVHYIACRWDYDVTPKETLLQHMALVTAIKTGIALTAFPADWGPHESTKRVADLSPGLMTDLRIETDDEVAVIFPYREDQVA